MRDHDRWEEKTSSFRLFNEDTFDWAGWENSSASFSDLDNHLEDTSKDWFNRQLRKQQ